MPGLHKNQRLQQNMLEKIVITTTLKDLRKYGACVYGYNKGVSALKGIPFDPERKARMRFAHAAPISLVSILDTNGLDDALWALRASTATDRDCRLFAVWCARQVERISPGPRVAACNDVAERFANGVASRSELEAAGDAARAAVMTTFAEKITPDAAWTAAWAARAAAGDAARAAQKEMFIRMCNGTAPWQKGSK